MAMGRLLEEDQGDNNDSKKYILWIILGSLVAFLVLAAFIIELLLSKSKKNEKKDIERQVRREKLKEKTQIESDMMFDHSGTRRGQIREAVFEEDEEQ